MAGISEFHQRENGAKTSGKFCSGCLLFLELFHFDCVSHEKHFVDRPLYPIETWGDKEVGRVLKYINQLGGMLDLRVGWKKVGGRVRTDDVAPGVSRQEFDLAMGRVGRLEDQVRNIGAEMGQGLLPSLVGSTPWVQQVPVDLDRSPPKKKVMVILSDSTSIVSPEKKDIPKPNPFEGKNRRINIGSFRVYGDGDVIDKGVVTNVCDPCSAQELVEKIVLSTTGDIWATRKHIKTLQPNQWVVDDVINMFSNYLNQEQNERDKTPRSHFLDTCFAQKIQSHLEGVSEGLLTGFPSKRSLVLDFAAGDMEFKFKKGLFAQFELYDPPYRPIQVNGDDCAIYVIMHMKHFGLVWWTGYDSHIIRMKLMIELVRNKYNQLWPTIESKVKKQLSSPSKKGSVKNPARRLSTKRRPSDVRRSG
ncbi:hypothetical protein ACLB2K_072467 [Fragaria x ananassa]